MALRILDIIFKNIQALPHWTYVHGGREDPVGSLNVQRTLEPLHRRRPSELVSFLAHD